MWIILRGKTIKGLKYIVIILLSLVWILYALPGMLVNIPFVQEKIAQTATEVLQEKLGVPVRIGNVDIEWFNRLVIEELYLEDQEGKVLFRANHLAAGMDVLPLLEGRLVFNTVRLFGPEVYLSKQNATSPLNLQFVIDAFARKDTTPKPKPKIDLRFNTILIRQGHFRYDVEDVPRTPGKFNAKHVDIHNLSAKISLRALRNDSINAQVKKMIGQRAIEIEVDGGINQANAAKVISAGADVLVAGTAVFDGGKYKQNIEALRKA